MSTDRIVLAYSGGLDTSVALRWLADEYGAEVIALLVDVGQGIDRELVERRAMQAGASEVVIVDARDEFARDMVLPVLQAGALYEGRYPLVSALSRPLIAQYMVSVAREYDAGAVAHGCTGKGNDQVRFETAVAALAPDLAVLAPVRDWGMTREQEIAYAEQHGIEVTVKSGAAYSIDHNLWGRSIEAGPLEDPWIAPTEDAYALTMAPERGLPAPQEVTIGFEDGVPVSIDGEAHRPGVADRAGGRARRRPRRRPHRHDRKPAGGHQEPRDLRGAGRGAAADRLRRRGGAGGRARSRPHQGAAGAALRGAGLQRPVVLAASPGAPGIHGRGRLGGHRRGPRAALPRLLRASSGGARRGRCTTTRWPPTSRATRTSTARRPGSSTSGRSAPRRGRRPPQRPPTWLTSRHDRSAVVGPASGWARPGDPGVLGLTRGRSPAAAA